MSILHPPHPAPSSQHRDFPFAVPMTWQYIRDWVVFVTVCMTKCALEYIDLRVTGSVQVGLGGWEYFSACLSLLIGVSFCMTVCDSINLTYPR